MKDYKNINPYMRSISVDWLVEVHSKLELLPETLYRAVSLMDQYVQVYHLIFTREKQTFMFISK
jgi:hypothetical protein